MFEQTFKNIDDILHKDAGYGKTNVMERYRFVDSK